MSILSPFASLALVSLVVAAAVLSAFKVTSNQPALKRAKRGVAAGLLELRLFQDDPLLVARALGRLLVQQALYLRYAIVPLLWLALPLLLLVARLDAWFARAPLAPGAASLVVVKVSTVNDAGRPALALHAPDGVRVETPVVWSPVTREAAWRIRAERPGAYTLRARSGEDELTHVLRVGEGLIRLDEQWSNHLGPSLINVDYPPRRFPIAGFSLSWLPVFLVLTFLLTLLLRPLFRVAL